MRSDILFRVTKRSVQATAPVHCNWQILRRQLLDQWQRLTATDVDNAGPDCHRIALLIERKYGVAPALVENYLHNFERTLPLAV